MSEASVNGTRPAVKGWATATVVVVGVAVYVVLDVLVQLLPPHYNPIRDAESDLGVGPFGWLMDVNFLVRAALTGCLVASIALVRPATPRRRAGCVLLGIWAVCSGLLAFFPTDVATAGRSHAVAPVQGTVHGGTVHGSIHLALAGIGFAAALAGVLVLTGWLRRGASAGRPGPAASAFAPTVLAAIAGVAFAAVVLTVRLRPGVFGVSERVFIAAILAWTVVVALRLRRVTD